MTPDFFKSYERIDNPYRIDVSQYTDELFTDIEYVVIWFGRIFRGSDRRNAVKLIEVIFLNLNNGFEVGVKIPIELAHRLPIGSIWVNGVTRQKYDFDDGLAVIQQRSANLNYSNHFGVSKNNGKFEFDLNNYPVNGLEHDANTLLVINQGSHKVLIHPLIFFMAHYGVSKEINRILLTYLWVDIEGKLNLCRPDPEVSDTIIVPDSCVIADAVFLYHLKHNQYTKKVTKELNTRVLDALQKNQNHRVPSQRSAPLKIVPYHEQQIEIGFKGITIEDGIILCTEITGMSMPQGAAINYALSEHESGEGNLDQDELSPRSYKPLFNKINTDEVVVEAESNAGNSTTAIVLQHIQTIGEIRELIRVENITIDQAIHRQRRRVIPLNEPIPSTFAVGERRGSNKAVGILRTLISSGVVDHQNPLFKRLLEYAQLLRADPEYPQYNDMIINCYSNGRLHGETTKYLNRHDGPTNVLGAYVLKLEADNEAYYIFDCSMASGVNRSGIGIKVDNDRAFDNIGIDAVLERLFDNDGKLSDQDTESLGLIYGSIVKFNHVNHKNSNWVRTALEKLNNPIAKK